MKAVIIEDKPLHIRQLKNLLTSHCRQVNIVGEANTAKEGAALITGLNPGLVFLDIKMPGGNGFKMLSSLGVYSFYVIFVTGYDKFAIQAIRCSALDYLLKPINVTDLKSAIILAESKFHQNSLESRIDNLAEIILHPEKKIEKIALPIANGHKFIDPHNIIYLKASNNYTTFFMNDSEEILISKGIYHFEDLLHQFNCHRCHASYIVNISFVKKFQRDLSGCELLLTNKASIPVTQKFIPLLKEALGLIKSSV